MQSLALKNFETQITSLSVEDRIFVIELILKSLKKDVPQATTSDWVEDTFSIMDKNSVCSNGKKWTRDELYTRGK